MEAETVAIQCWKAYIESYGKAPENTADFQRWLHESSFFRNIAQDMKNNDESDEGNDNCHSVISDFSTPSLPPSKQTPCIHLHDEQNKATALVLQVSYGSNSISDHKQVPKQASNQPIRPLSKMSSTKSATTTFANIPTAMNMIRTISVSPKLVPNIIPKTDLDLFLSKYDIKDLKSKLKHYQIGFTHLKTVDTDDLNELCSYLKLSITEKIRFKCAVKDIQQNCNLSPNNYECGYQNGLIQSKSDEFILTPAILGDDEYAQK